MKITISTVANCISAQPVSTDSVEIPPWGTHIISKQLDMCVNECKTCVCVCGTVCVCVPQLHVTIFGSKVNVVVLRHELQLQLRNDWAEIGRDRLLPTLWTHFIQTN